MAFDVGRLPCDSVSQAQRCQILLRLHFQVESVGSKYQLRWVLGMVDRALDLLSTQRSRGSKTHKVSLVKYSFSEPLN
jgi:hypothetical protein